MALDAFGFRVIFKMGGTGIDRCSVLHGVEPPELSNACPPGYPSYGFEPPKSSKATRSGLAWQVVTGCLASPDAVHRTRSGPNKLECYALLPGLVGSHGRSDLHQSSIQVFPSCTPQVVDCGIWVPRYHILCSAVVEIFGTGFFLRCSAL
jgi:hypothetical protein